LISHRKNLGIKQVTAITRNDNRASKNVLQKLGFKTQGQVIIENTNIAVDVYLLNTERN